MVVRIIVFLITLSCMTISFVFSNNFYTGKEKVVLLKTVETKNSFISYVTINGLFYVLKQKKDVHRPITAVREALAAFIAQDLHIAQSVQIIPINVAIPGKRHAHSVATLHSLAAGKKVRSHHGKYALLCLKQRLPKVTGKWLTEEIIDQITWHKQLPLIIALDLFIANTDRHGGNLFYDEVMDRFCAIDMDNIFRRDLCDFACQKLDLMVNSKKHFTPKEIIALTSVRNTLEFLLKKYSTQHIIAQLRIFAKQVSDASNNAIEKKKLAKKVASHEEMIIKSRDSIYRLIGKLNKIIANSIH